jgi:hypothetical protein
MLDVVEPISEFENGREFQVWRYIVSHAQLLLRSYRNDQIGTERYGDTFTGRHLTSRRDAHAVSLRLVR